jgi:F0F1-type ATP synthase membrane subunit c/vacuolar-type H+-ATPase subunit K
LFSGAAGSPAGASAGVGVSVGVSTLGAGAGDGVVVDSPQPTIANDANAQQNNTTNFFMKIFPFV